jgi:ABC-type polysaccharide/polyol phosphate export permease
MDIATEAPVVYRSSAARPDPVTLIATAILDIVSRRRLIRYLIRADVKKKGADTVLGNLWWILDPLLQLVVYVIFVSVISRGRGIEDYPLFIFVAIIPWTWFSAVITDATTCVVGAERLIRQIAFPKLVLPVSVSTAGVVGFLWGLVPLAGLLLVYRDRLSVMLVWLPVVAFVQFVFTVAMAIAISAANVFFRDLGNALGHLLRLWWFLSPGLYSLDNLESVKYVQDHPIVADIFRLNPFAVLFEAYRAVIYGVPDGPQPSAHPPDLIALGALLLASVVLLGLCITFFKRVEPEFAKVL